MRSIPAALPLLGDYFPNCSCRCHCVSLRPSSSAEAPAAAGEPTRQSAFPDMPAEPLLPKTCTHKKHRPELSARLPPRGCYPFLLVRSYNICIQYKLQTAAKIRSLLFGRQTGGPAKLLPLQDRSDQHPAEGELQTDRQGAPAAKFPLLLCLIVFR